MSARNHRYLSWMASACMVLAACGNEVGGQGGGQGSDQDVQGDAGAQDVAMDSGGGPALGEVLWSFHLPQKDAGQEACDDALAVGSDGVIYALARPFGGGFELYAIGPDGQQRWVFDGLPTSFDAACMGVVLSEATGTLYVPCSDPQAKVGRVFAVSTDGSARWSAELGTGDWPVGAALRSWGNPLHDRLYLTSVIPQPHATKPEVLYSVDSNGKLGPTYTGDAGFTGLAIGPDGTVYTTTPKGALLALDQDLGKKWQLDLSAGTPTGAIAIGSDGTRYVGTTAPSGLVAVALDPGTGGPFKKWTYSTPSGVAPPSFMPDGSIVLIDMSVGLVALNPADGTERWRVAGSASNFYQNAALADGTVLYGIDYALAARNPSGDHVNLTGYITVQAPPAIGLDGTIYAAGQCADTSKSNDCIYALQGSGPAASGWFRGTGDDANTRWGR